MAGAEQTKKPLKIVGLGNPLLDISSTVPDSFFEKYGVKLDNAILAEEAHFPMYPELVKDFSPDFIAGGATQNSIRVAQWMLNSTGEKVTGFFGCVGKDSYMETLKKCAQEDGVDVCYMIDESTPTGTCAVLLNGEGERSLIANLQAANNFKAIHLETPEAKKLIDGADIFYTSGFHLTVSPDAMIHLGKHANENNKLMTINLSAPFIAHAFKDPLEKLLPYADIVFGNENEAAALGEVMGWGDDLKVVAQKLSQLPKNSGAHGRTVVFTQGSDPTIVFRDGKVTTYDVTPLAKEEIVDTNGAGDAFVGGFLSQIALGKSIADAVKAGHWSAGQIIRQSGCTFAGKSTYEN